MNIAEQDALHSMFERIDALTETLGIAGAAPVLNAHIASRIFGDGGLAEVLAYAAAAGYRVSNTGWLWLDGRHLIGTPHDRGIDRVPLAVIDPRSEITDGYLEFALNAYSGNGTLGLSMSIGKSTADPVLLEEPHVLVVHAAGKRLEYDTLTDTWRRA